MTNNDILRRIRYTFNYSDADMMNIFMLSDYSVSRETLCNWLKKDDDPEFEPCKDRMLSIFLNGFICKRRGKREGAQPEIEQQLTNNIIFRKLKIALDLQAEEVLEMLKNTDLAISKHELSAFFRKPTHKHYRECKDQILRKFLQGMQQKYRGLNERQFTGSL
ncbi:MAG: DUF1456 family protein [Deltaproteobacteria bacterium]|nr:DUF1456 family protein [Deltaproteobacteria bacterium]